MDEYFITKKAVEIILANINDHFVKCLIRLSTHEKYTDDIKVIIGIIELLKTYMETRRNDILSSCIKYTNKAYYLQLTDNLFRLIQSHLTTTRYVFISDLISKYEHPVISAAAAADSVITRNYKDDTVRNRFNTEYADEDTKDAGTLFKEAYNKLKETKSANATKSAKAADIELQMMDDKKNHSDLL